MTSAFAKSCAALFILGLAPATAQLAPPDESTAARVTVTLNADGSRTNYRFDPANRRALSVRTGQDGKVLEKIRYELDERGRFANGVVSGPDGKFRFKSIYKYDDAGRLQEESHLGKDDALLTKLVYHYDPAGKQTGYSVFDASGKLLDKTPAAKPSAAPKDAGQQGKRP